METIRGQAQVLNRGAQVHYGDNSVTVTNEVSFTIDGTTAVMKSPNTILMESGDAVVIAGERGRDGVFKAYAVNNLTRGIINHCESVVHLIIGGVFVVFGIPFILFLGAGLIFIGAGTWMLLNARKMTRARKMVLAG